MFLCEGRLLQAGMCATLFIINSLWVIVINTVQSHTNHATRPKVNDMDEFHNRIKPLCGLGEMVSIQTFWNIKTELNVYKLH